MVVTPLLAVVPASLPVESMRDFIELLRAKPGGFSYGSGGVGNLNHLGVEFFKMRTGTQISHSPTSSRSAALRSLVEGRVQFMMDGGHVVGRYVQEGSLRILASWLGLVAPARTPKAVVARLQKEIEQALSNPKFRDRLLAQGTEPAFLSSDAFGALIEAEQRRWAEVVRVSGIKIR